MGGYTWARLNIGFGCRKSGGDFGTLVRCGRKWLAKQSLHIPQLVEHFGILDNPTLNNLQLNNRF